MISKAQEKLIRSLHTKKGRERSGLCLVEGEKVIETAGDEIEYSFTKDDSENFRDLITTETPQEIAAVAKIPEWSLEDVAGKPTIIVLDGVQDPGNIGSILRLCLGFNASLLLIDSADVTNPKVIRSSVGALFQVPWIKMSGGEAAARIPEFGRPIYRLESTEKSEPVSSLPKDEKIVLIAGSEGQGIKQTLPGTSMKIKHDPKLESLNVTHALAIALHERNK